MRRARCTSSWSTLHGLDLAHIIERDGPMPWARYLSLFAQIAGALRKRWLGIVHRDLKPENVLITRTTGARDFTAKVLEHFGLAKLADAPKAAPRTRPIATQIVGTPYFMAPEQIRGDDVDARTDHVLARRADVRAAHRPAPVSRADRGRRAHEAPDERARRAVDPAQSEA